MKDVTKPFFVHFCSPVADERPQLLDRTASKRGTRRSNFKKRLPPLSTIHPQRNLTNTLINVAYDVSTPYIFITAFFLIEFTRFKQSFRGDTKKAWSLGSIFYNKFFEISAKERSK